MAPQHENVVVGRDELIAGGEDDRSTIESKDDAALLVSRAKLKLAAFCGEISLTCL